MKSGVRKLIQNVLLGQRRTVSSNLIPLSRQGALLGVDTSRTVRCSSSSSRSTENKVNDQFEASSVDTTVKGDGSSSTDSNGEELTSSATKKEVHEEEKGKDAVLSEELKEAVAHERSKPPPSIVDQIIAMLGIKTGTPFTYSTAKSLLDNCLVSSKKNYWFDDSMGKIGKDFRSRHTLLLIYVWMIHKRLLKMGEKGQDIQECMFDELWEDTSGRIRNLGIGELSVNKRLSEVQGYSFKFCIELDDAITRNTEEEVIDEIAGTLWRMLYLKREDIDPADVIDLATYIRKEQISLFNISNEAILDGRINFEDPPFWNIVPGKATAALNVWEEVVANNGKTYYWNIETGETTWEKPKTDQ